MILETALIAAPVAAPFACRNQLVKDAGRIMARAFKAAKILAKDERLPKKVRYPLIIACLPWPGPQDNIVQLACLAILFRFYREPLIEAWEQTR